MPQKSYLGLDIGSSGTKAIAVDKSGNVQNYGLLDMKAEGILNETELYSSISEWLVREQWNKFEITAGLPQYMTTVLARNYPEKLPQKAIMLQLETEASQVAGLSDEPMLQDGCLLGKTCIRTNSVIIGISREQNVRERLNAMENAGIAPAELVPGGIALTNAFYALNPEQIDSAEPVLLLELGNENSTAIVLAGGQPLFLSSLLFSTEKVNETIRKRGAEHKVKMEERDMRTINIQDENSHSSIMEALFSLENEIQAFVESWRAQETEELAEKPISQVVICGGLSQMRGLQSWLQSTLEVPVSILAPTCNGEAHPELTQAYGLALQLTKHTRLKLSLLPQDIRKERLRMKNWPCLAAAILVCFFVMAIIDIRVFLTTQMKLTQAKDQNKEVNQCTRVASEILNLQQMLKNKEIKMRPLIVAGNQNTHLWKTVNSLGNACTSKDWFVYLADETSYQKYREGYKQKEHQTPPKKENLFATASSIGDTSNANEFPLCINPENMTSPHSFIAAGYTPQIYQEPYKSVKDILLTMEKTGVFTRTDILAENERIGREDIFEPWMNYLPKISGAQFKAFTVRLPLQNPDILLNAHGENNEEEEDEE